MQKKRVFLKGLILFVGLSILAACGGSQRFVELRQEQPSTYYLYVPEAYTESKQWPLFIALPDSSEDSEDCISNWFEIAEDNQFFLLCPELSTTGRSIDGPASERLLASILNRLYQDYSLRTSFFLVGKSEAADFALSYAYRYPRAINAVSAITPAEYPSGVATTNFPILIIVEQGDSQASEAGNAFIQRLTGGGTQTRLLEIENLRGRIPYSVQRLTVDFFEQVSR